MATYESSFTYITFIVRLLYSLLLVFATYNPTGYSYVDWVLAGGPGFLSVKIAAGVALLTAYIVFVHISYTSIGLRGLLTGAVYSFLASFAIAYSGPPDSLLRWVGDYVLLISLAGALAVGVSWSHFQKRLTGQLQRRHIAGREVL
ncbi:MAG: hypothetical protein HY057_10740 [Rhodospirillales bacterium]|nr:hypothetical protein [Rhodospirillales bacterium]